MRGFRFLVVTVAAGAALAAQGSGPPSRRRR
ncbi:hypothetical protein STRAU_4929 [Streptomyces aurantiacus JA 4570]|uniref:Uncharacterized protein n=1 Tax=Streptomyces aurantiacus JA 4570 TaxID=1286094 RepID=S4AKT3_9ACTN|nr:hypothetical protein STRAU_4929 [Streptomyces aurantiacus JA 4570]